MSKRCLVYILFVAFSALPARAQLNDLLDSVFDSILRDGFVTSPGEHGNHFIDAAERAGAELTPVLNSLIVQNISAFPLASSVAGLTFDPVTGEILTSSLGPIFSEPVETVGTGNFSLGLNTTFLSFDKFRGLPVELLRFAFLHEDIGLPGLGDSINEHDVLDVELGLEVSSVITAFYATFGVMKNLDVSVAVPFVTVSMKGTTKAVMNSASIILFDQANHRFGGTTESPDLTKDVEYDESSSGIGDVAARIKYRFTDTNSLTGMAVLLDVRLPTGDTDDFLGSGNTTGRIILIGSHAVGNFTPHINTGYNYRNSDIESDKFELNLGFDQVILPNLVFAFEFLGAFDLDTSKTPQIFEGSETITGVADVEVDLSNAPVRDNDNRMDAAFGARYAPVLTQSLQVQLLANIMVPLQNGGLRSNVTPTFGVSVSF